MEKDVIYEYGVDGENKFAQEEIDEIRIMDSIDECRAHNHALESSPEYQRILPEVMKEVYTQFVNESIKREEDYLESLKDMEDKSHFSRPITAGDLPFLSPPDKRSIIDETKSKIASAKELMPNNPERAAEYFFRLGDCHTLWGLQKGILKEKYGIIWYTPAELYPDFSFD